MIGALAIIAGIYAIVIAALFFKQGALIYPARSQRVVAADLDPHFSDIVLRTRDGLALNAVYRPSRDGRPTAVFFHGNGDNLQGAAAATQWLAGAGYGLLLVEYRGYSGNPGTPGEAGLYDDGRAAMAWLAAQGVPPNRIVLIGNSLGSGVATQLATEFPVAGLVLISPFTSLPDVAAAKVRWAPIRSLLRDRYENLAKVRRLKLPILIVHGDADTLIPVSHGEALAAAAARGRLVRVPGIGHELAYRPQSGMAITRWLSELPAKPVPNE